MKAAAFILGSILLTQGKDFFFKKKFFFSLFASSSSSLFNILVSSMLRRIGRRPGPTIKWDWPRPAADPAGKGQVVLHDHLRLNLSRTNLSVNVHKISRVLLCVHTCVFERPSLCTHLCVCLWASYVIYSFFFVCLCTCHLTERPKPVSRVLAIWSWVSSTLTMRTTSNQWLRVTQTGPLISQAPCGRKRRQPLSTTCHLEKPTARSTEVNVAIKQCSLMCFCFVILQTYETFFQYGFIMRTSGNAEFGLALA